MLQWLVFISMQLQPPAWYLLYSLWNLRVDVLGFGVKVGFSVGSYDWDPSIHFILISGLLHIYIKVVSAPSTLARGNKDTAQTSYLVSESGVVVVVVVVVGA